jgi:hypothetical protein
MMKNKQTEKSGNNRGAALMIALLASVVVMLAATLLISLTSKMVDAHVSRLNNAQISLSESSAADGLASLLVKSGNIVTGEPLVFQLGGVSTEFTLIETGTAGIRTGFYSIDNPGETVIIPAGNRLVSARRFNDSSVLITFYSGESFQPTADFILETDLLPMAGTPFTYRGEPASVIVLQGNSKSLLCVVTSEGVQNQVIIDSTVLTEHSVLSAGESSTGTPLLIVTGGANQGALYNCETGEAERIWSPPGTCPAFLPDGGVFGSFTGEMSSFSMAFIRDVLGGDFNNDGISDLAFATSFSLSVYSGATGDIFTSGPGGSLITWGSVEGRTGICGMWAMPGGDEKWFRLGYDGFTEFTPEATFRMGWQGRFNGSGNTIVGFIDGSAVVASSSGYMLELLTGNVFTGDADGGETDFFRTADGGIDACFNPVSGDGQRLVFSSVNTYRGKNYPGQTHIFQLYESGGARRVFHNLEGLGS